MAPPKKKKAAAKSAKPPTFDLLSSGSKMVNQVSEMVAQAKAGSGGRYAFGNASAFQPEFVNLDPFTIQAALMNRGIAKRSMLELIAPEGIGKTSFMVTLLGLFMNQGCPCLYIETEEKPMLERRFKQCLDTHIPTADKMWNALNWTPAYTILEAIEKVSIWLSTMRSKKMSEEFGISSETPLVVCIDTWSKLMAPNESAGRTPYEDKLKAGEKKKVMKEIGTASNLEAAKMGHIWVRTWPALFRKYNVIFLINAHQNAKIDMTATASFMSAEASAFFNKTTRGGKAFDQSAAIQLIGNRIGNLKSSDGDPIGHTVMCRVDKNSYGVNNTRFSFNVNTTYQEDGEFQNPAVDLNSHLAKFFADRKIMGTKVERKRYTCEAIGVDGVTDVDFAKAFYRNPEVVESIGARLGIHGYNRPVNPESVNVGGRQGLDESDDWLDEESDEVLDEENEKKEETEADEVEK